MRDAAPALVSFHSLRCALTGSLLLLLHHHLLLALLLPGCETRTVTSQPTAAPQLDREGLAEALEAILDEHGGGLEASVWVGGAAGEPWFVRGACVPRPTASAIKTSYLVELFAQHGGALDRTLPGAEALLADDTHPAWAPFPAKVRAEIRANLGGASVRRIGEMMIRGKGVSNATYNAAANLSTAVLGGPAALTRAIHARDPRFDGITVRRYMLAARNVTGDNEATAASLAAVLQGLASRELRGIDSATVDALRAVLFLAEDGERGRHFFKGGSLGSEPLTRVRSGWWERGERRIVYVVMTEQPCPQGVERTEAGKRLAATAERLTEAVLQALRFGAAT